MNREQMHKNIDAVIDSCPENYESIVAVMSNGTAVISLRKMGTEDTKTEHLDKDVLGEITESRVYCVMDQLIREINGFDNRDCYSCKHSLDIGSEENFECEVTGENVDSDYVCQKFER